MRKEGGGGGFSQCLESDEYPLDIARFDRFDQQLGVVGFDRRPALIDRDGFEFAD